MGRGKGWKGRPERHKDKGAAAPRLCLMCGREFDSEWIGQRTCKPCKAGRVYKSGLF